MNNAKSICKSCGSEVEGDFHTFCEEGCPTCGSHNTVIETLNPRFATMQVGSDLVGSLRSRLSDYFATDGVLHHSYGSSPIKFTDKHVDMMIKDILNIIKNSDQN